jgi:hypothetical protein
MRAASGPSAPFPAQPASVRMLQVKARWRMPSGRTALALCAVAYWGGLAFLRFGPMEVTGTLAIRLVPVGAACLLVTLYRLWRVGLPLAAVVPLWLWYDPLLYWLVLWPGLEALWAATGPWASDLPFVAFSLVAEAWPLVAPTAFCVLVFLPERSRERAEPPTPAPRAATSRLRLLA